jgi:hypothetical protein
MGRVVIALRVFPDTGKLRLSGAIVSIASIACVPLIQRSALVVTFEKISGSPASARLPRRNLRYSLALLFRCVCLSFSMSAVDS